LKKDLQDSNREDEEDKDKKEGSKDGPRESQEKIEKETRNPIICLLLE